MNTAIPSHAEVLNLSVARLRGDPPLMTLMAGRIFNHIPQDSPLPCCRVRWGQAGEWDTKDSSGFDGYLFVDVWTNHRGDKEALEATDRILALINLLPLQMSSGQSLIMRHDYVDTFTEPDGLTHHTAIRFHHIATN